MASSMRQILDMEGDEEHLDQDRASQAVAVRDMDVDGLLREIGFEGDPRMIATVEFPTDSQMADMLDEMDQRDQEGDSSVLSWSGKGASRGAEMVGVIPPGSDSGIAGFEAEIVGYANDVHQGDNVSERGMSIYGERQPDSMLAVIEDDEPETREDRDIDIGTQGSRDAHVEYGIGGATGSPTAWSEFQSGEEFLDVGVGMHEVGSLLGTRKGQILLEGRRGVPIAGLVIGTANQAITDSGEAFLIRPLPGTWKSPASPDNHLFVPDLGGVPLGSREAPLQGSVGDQRDLRRQASHLTMRHS